VQTRIEVKGIQELKDRLGGHQIAEPERTENSLTAKHEANKTEASNQGVIKHQHQNINNLKR